MLRALVIVFLLSFQVHSLVAQKYLQLDKYGIRKEQLRAGDPIRFKLIGGSEIYVDEIAEIEDSLLYLRVKAYALPVNQIEIIYLKRASVKNITQTATFLAFWFLVAGAVEWYGDYENFNEATAGVIGASMLGLGQGVKLFRWKKYRVTKNARLRILETI